MKQLKVVGPRFITETGHEVHLRGVNLGGSSKMPSAEPTHIVNNFSRHREVSFVGRPFPAHEAHEHYARLHHWGFNCLRFLVTWEAVEHAGYGVYDQEYLDYLTTMVALAGDYGFHVFIDPHQDAWSRMTGGDGAPGWTLEAVGFDIRKLDQSEAAITMQRRYPDYPTMVWTDNNSRLGSLTMFTLFLCGNRFAPGLEIGGVPVQDYLQGAFIQAMLQITHRLKDMPHVIGYGPINEPAKGFIGLSSLTGINVRRPRMASVTAQDALFMGGGFPRTVARVHFSNGEWHVAPEDMVTLNPDGVSAWQSPAHDVWRNLGVWGIDAAGQPVILKDDYFAGANFLRDGLIPFNQRYAEAIRTVDPDAILFLESTPIEARAFSLGGVELGAVVNASHWYDEQMLFTRQFNGELARDLGTEKLVHGREAVIEAYRENIEALVKVSQAMGDVPTLIGEFGLCYDINGKSAFRDGDFSLHELALSLYYDALDANLVHSAQWNYTADNNNQWGDNWNEEDLSIFSRDQQANPADIHSGGRAVRGFCRPWVMQVAGRLRSRRFDWQNAVFTAVVDAEEILNGQTLVYVPDIWYFDNDYSIEVSSGTWQATDHPQVIAWVGAKGQGQTLVLRRGRSLV